MQIRIFNFCLLLGWLLVLGGGVLLDPGLGLVAAGLLLIVLTLVAVRIAGGLVASPPKKPDPAKGEEAP
jgi:hypothetical protein